MTTRQFKTRTNLVGQTNAVGQANAVGMNSVQRAAFTLVELMIVIVIIGILAAIATPVVNAALKRAKEFTIENEVQQLSAAIDKFETEHGFFPPTLNVGGAINSEVDFFRYLNRIAPNHSEGTPGSGGGLDNWWDVVGRNLDERSSLVFWLSGLCTSKQYPLSGSAAMVEAGAALAPYDSNILSDDTTAPPVPVPITRQVLYEFKFGQLVNAGNAPNGVKVYNQPHGKSSEDLSYRYLDKSAYNGNAYFNGSGFFNPKTFQIVGPGLDGVLFDATTPDRDLTDAPADPTQDDNITNFSGGRLERSYDE